MRLDRAPSLHEQFSVRLRRALIGGEFLPGERINVREVARRFGTSAMPVRDALRRLEAVGAVVIESRKAPRIATLSPGEYAQIIEMRRLLESRAARLACGCAKPGDASRLKELHRKLLGEWQRGDIHGVITANAAFHFCLYEMAGEAFLLSTIENLWLRCGPYLQLAALSQKQASESLRHSHAEIIRAVESRDGKAGARALLQDIGCGVEDYQATIARDATSAVAR